MYRRLDNDGGSLKWDAIRDLGVDSDGHDIGPSVSAHDKTIHIATPSGIDIVSADAGATWQPTPIALPPGRKIKTVSVALDSSNEAHFAISAMVRGPEHPSTEAASRGYWELRSISRAPDGTWGKSENILQARPEWGEPSGQDDVLADWARILADGTNALHVTWHGTAVSRIYGNDRSYYDYRPRGAETWEKPALLVPTNDIPGSRFSFAPSLALGNNVAVALTFYDVYDGARWGGFDALARMLRAGKLDGKPLPISQWVHASIQSHRPEIALSARFPSAAPTLFYAPDGRIWLDVLETLIPMGIPGAPKLIAYQRVDVTSWLDGKSPAAPAAIQVADKPPEPGTVLFTLRDLLSYVPNLIERP